MNKPSTFTTEVVDVVWSHLHAPDDKFGADSSNHNITILVDSALQKELDEIVKNTAATKINGMRVDDEGRTMLKVKSKSFVKKDVKVFPCRDAKANKTEAVPFGGDKVRLRLSPAVLTRDQSLSFYLNGVQIIEKNIMDTGGFEATDGFDGSDFVAPVKEETEETPF
tara:strand:+ start:417 stop:917 length:501 start_codon:yes stop_codon:yes gene_type:complete